MRCGRRGKKVQVWQQPFPHCSVYRLSEISDQPPAARRRDQLSLDFRAIVVVYVPIRRLSWSLSEASVTWRQYVRNEAVRGARTLLYYRFLTMIRRLV